MQAQKIPIASLDTKKDISTQHYSTSILEGEIKDVHVEHVAAIHENAIQDAYKKGIE